MERTLFDYWLVLYERKWIIGIILLSTLATVWFLSMILPPVYEAKAVFFVPTKPDSVTFLAAPGVSTAKTPLVPEAKEEPQAPYIGILKSKAIAELVQEEFPHKTVTDLRRRDMDFVVNDEYLLEVYARDRDPKMAAGIANAYLKYFNELMQGYPENLQMHIRESLERQIEKTEEELLSARMELEEFKRENNTVSIDEETKQYISMKMNFKNKIDTQKVAYSENEVKINALIEQLKKEGNLLTPTEFTVTSPLLANIQKELTDVEVKMAGLRAEIKESHIDFILLKNRYAQLEKEMEKEVNRITKSQIKAPDTFYESLRRQLIDLYVDRERLMASMNACVAVLNDIDTEMKRIPAIQAEWDRLAMEIEKNKKLLDTFKTNLEEVLAQKEKKMQVAVIVDKATIPETPSFPVLWLNLIVAGMAGTIAGVFYAFFINYIEETRKIRTTKIIKELLSEE